MIAWQAYFAYQLLHAYAAELAQPFEDEDFDFWQRYLAGVKEPRPRNVRCVAATDRALGDLLGQKYIQLAFGADAKAQITTAGGRPGTRHGRRYQHASLDDGSHQGRSHREAQGHHQ